MADYYNETKRLAQLIGLDYHASDGKRVVYRQAPCEKACTFTQRKTQWVPWRPFKDATDRAMIHKWLDKHHPAWYANEGWRAYRPELLCLAVLEMFDPPDIRTIATDPGFIRAGERQLLRQAYTDTLTPAEAEIALAELADRLVWITSDREACASAARRAAAENDRLRAELAARPELAYLERMASILAEARAERSM